MVTFRTANGGGGGINSAASDLERLKNYDELNSLLIRFADIESSTSEHFPHWRESIFNFQHSQWIDALNVNNSLEQVTVNLSVTPDATCWTKRHAETFVRAILSIPALERLTLVQNDFLGSSQTSIGSMQAVTHAIQSARCLTHLELRWMRCPTTTDNTITSNVSSMAGAVRNCRRLQSLTIMGDQTNVDIIRSLVPVLRNNNIKRLCIGNVTSEAFHPFLDALAACTNIENNNNNNTGSITTLETLKVVFNHHVDDNTCERLARTLIPNQCLQVLSLHQNCNHQRRPTTTTTTTTNHNRQHDDSFINDEGYKSIIRLVENNYTLREVNLLAAAGSVVVGGGSTHDNHGHHHRDKIEFYTKLNRAGRRKLFVERREKNNNNASGTSSDDDGTTRMDWINVLAGCEGEVDCLYHILHMNPSILFCGQG